MFETFLHTSLLLQATPDVASPDSVQIVLGFSPLELLLLGLSLVVFLGGAWTIINLSNQTMELARLERLKELSPEQIAAAGPAVATNTDIPLWKRIYNKLTDDVPIENEEAILLDHEYDGVRELDNNLPPWWKGLFYLSIAFAPIYIWYTHFSDLGLSSREEYAVEMEVAEAEVRAFLATQEDVVDESNVEYLPSPEDLQKGELIFVSKCAMCHGQLGEGGIGPNLTDDYWLHGNTMADIFKSVKYGYPDKGMIAWEDQLRPRDMQEVSSYIKSLAGTEPDNAKEPQGELIVAERGEE